MTKGNGIGEGLHVEIMQIVLLPPTKPEEDEGYLNDTVPLQIFTHWRSGFGKMEMRSGIMTNTRYTLATSYIKVKIRCAGIVCTAAEIHKSGSVHFSITDVLSQASEQTQLAGPNGLAFMSFGANGTSVRAKASASPTSCYIMEPVKIFSE
jgi:hypothetical protein